MAKLSSKKLVAKTKASKGVAARMRREQTDVPKTRSRRAKAKPDKLDRVKTPARRPAGRPAARSGQGGNMKRDKGQEAKTKPTNDKPLPPAASSAQPIQARVTSDAKPKKSLAGLSSKEMEHFRDLLLAKRRELVGDMSSMEREALRTGGGTNLSNLPIHMADMGTDNYEQEFTLGLMEKDRKLLREINVALAKLQDGTYGLCEGTGKPISKPRLEAQPWARFSIEYARQMEKGPAR